MTPVVLDETVGHKTSRIESDLGRYRDTHTEQLRSLSKFQNNSDHITSISWLSCLGRVISSEEKLFYLQLFLKFDFLQKTHFVSLRNNYNKIGGYVFLWIKYPPPWDYPFRFYKFYLLSCDLSYLFSSYFSSIFK